MDPTRDKRVQWLVAALLVVATIGASVLFVRIDRDRQATLERLDDVVAQIQVDRRERIAEGCAKDHRIAQAMRDMVTAAVDADRAQDPRVRAFVEREMRVIAAIDPESPHYEGPPCQLEEMP